MGDRSRPFLRVRNIPTGTPKFEDEPSFMQREFGLDPEDPALTWIVRSISRLAIEYGIDARQSPEVLARCIQRGREQYEYERQQDEKRLAGWDPVVYYVRVGPLIKIGTSVNLRDRLKAYPPGAAVLATEPGGFDLEGRRHKQFRDSLAARAEWFHPSAALIEHVNSLRAQPLSAADLAA